MRLVRNGDRGIFLAPFIFYHHLLLNDTSKNNWGGLMFFRQNFIYLQKMSKAMKEKIISTKIEVLSYDELSAQDKELIDKAKEATSTSYSPYSKFHVGAALLLSNGEIVTGSNQENAAFPSGTCAERTTIYYAHARYPEASFDTLAIAAFSNGHFQASPVSPCGACRQAILEYETLFNKNIRILLYGENEIYLLDGIKSLLPLCFSEF